MLGTALVIVIRKNGVNDGFETFMSDFISFLMLSLNKRVTLSCDVTLIIVNVLLCRYAYLPGLLKHLSRKIHSRNIYRLLLEGR